MILATLSGPLPKLGVVAVAGLAAIALVARAPRARANALAGALVLAPVLLLGDVWHSPQLRIVHRHPLIAALLAAAGLAAVCAGAWMMRRDRRIFPLLALAALPFRIPIEAGGVTANLLVPLYLVVAAGAIAFVVPAWREDPDADVESRWQPGALERVLAGIVLLYALQATYSGDFTKALQNVVFFYVPFALLYVLLAQIEWREGLVRRAFGVLVGLALLFAAIGFVEYATKTILLNPKLVQANDLHTYFRVNSVFFDPNIYGRFLALTMVAIAALLLRAQRPRTVALCTAGLAVLWGGLVLTLSQSSLGALLAGLAVLAALRWPLRRAALVAAVVVLAGAVAVAVSPGTFGLSHGLDQGTSGRAGLVGGGTALFADRPLTGYGSGSFAREYRRHRHKSNADAVSASHTTPITIAAEQGVLGVLLYLALLATAALALLRGASRSPARAALAAAFVALVVHSLVYAAFLEDPLTWTVLAVGAVLGLARSGEDEPAAGDPATAIA